MFSIRLLWITSLLIVVLVIASAISAAQEVVTFWHYGAASVLEVMQQLAADFEAENPGIKIEIVNVPYTPDFEKWTVALAGGAGPDASLGNFGVFAALGDALVPLEGFAERSE